MKIIVASNGPTFLTEFFNWNKEQMKKKLFLKIVK